MNNKFLWSLWMAMVLSFGLVLAAKMNNDQDKRYYTPDPLSHEQHRISLL